MATIDGEEERGSIFRDVKGAKNQSLFREVNERIKEVGHHSDWRPYEEDAICECANDECSEAISLSITEYEAVRQHGTRFVVAPSDEHVFPEIECVVEKRDGYWVVEKLDAAGAVAEKLDPRSRATKTIISRSA